MIIGSSKYSVTLFRIEGQKLIDEDEMGAKFERRQFEIEREFRPSGDCVKYKRLSFQPFLIT